MTIEKNQRKSVRGRFSNRVQDEIREDGVFIIGAGHFGARAARLLSTEMGVPVFVVDIDDSRLADLEKLPVKGIRCDGIRFLVRNYRFLYPGNTIVPAVPVNLIYEWVKAYLEEDFIIEKVRVPPAIGPLLPQTWAGTEGSLLVSYADFICPDNCPEPERCTVTGEVRDKPLYTLLRQLNVSDFKVHVTRSRQLAPGVGGYRVSALAEVADRLRKEKGGKWLLGTSCKCHGILTALEVKTVS
jgi:hypothetical protein